MSAMIDVKVENAGSDVIRRSQWQDLVRKSLILDRCHLIDTCRYSVNSERKTFLLVLIFNLRIFIHHGQFNSSICLNAAGPMFCSFCLSQALAS